MSKLTWHETKNWSDATWAAYPRGREWGQDDGMLAGIMLAAIAGLLAWGYFSFIA